MSGIVAIVGSAKTTRERAPWDDPKVKIWGINEAMAFPWMRRADAMFQMHARWSFTRSNNRNDPGHWQWLQQKHLFPIYMQRVWTDIPSSVEYPLEQVVERFGRRYFTSSVAYMIALAMLLGFERIEIYGVEMATDSEYFWQRDCVMYWIGRAEGMGVDVYLPSGCGLFKGRLYGYEGGRVIERQYIEMRLNKLVMQEQAMRDRLQAQSGRVKLLAEQFTEHPELSGDFEQALKDERQALADLAGISGARRETEHYLAECDALLRAAGNAPDVPGDCLG